MSSLDDMRQYLLPLDTTAEDKRYAMYFCKKLNYLNELRNAIIKDTNESYISMGYGNVNAKICIVVKDEEMFNIVKPLIQDILERFDVNFWNIYVTFIDKTKTPYKEKYELLVNEINAIKPNLMYVIDKDDTMYLEMIRSFCTLNIDFPEKYFFIDLEYLASTDIEVRKLLWRDFRYLINYKEIEQ